MKVTNRCHFGCQRHPLIATVGVEAAAAVVAAAVPEVGAADADDARQLDGSNLFVHVMRLNLCSGDVYHQRDCLSHHGHVRRTLAVPDPCAGAHVA